MKTKSLLLTGVAILLSSSVTMAQQPTDNSELIAKLEQAKQDCAWQARNLKGGPKGSMLLHQRTMDNVLEQLKAGQKVDQQRVYKAFENHSG
jgi:hypothetical protein